MAVFFRLLESYGNTDGKQDNTVKQGEPEVINSDIEVINYRLCALGF